MLVSDDFLKKLDFYNGIVVNGSKPVYYVGIRYNKGEIFTYKQEKVSISEGFCERIVLKDRKKTKPIR